MVIGVCGYTSTGSSAVSDYLKEFSSNSVLDKCEFTITHHPDGLEDLDFHLNEKISKFTSSTVAIKRFRRTAHTLLHDRTRGEIDKLVDEYINKICQAKWSGYASNDFVLYNNWFYKNVEMRIIRSRILEPLANKFNIYPNFFPSREMEYAICPDNFNEASIDFVKAILISMGVDINKNIVLDQPFAGNDPLRSFKYFEDPIAIIVDRDPRDNYIFTKEVLKARGRQIPTNTVDNFISYYKNMRKVAIPSDKRILKVRFEDMVYDYDATTKILRDYLGLDESDRNKTLFVPETSKHNTCLYRRFTQYDEDIKKIEKCLPEYLYDFEAHHDQLPTSNGKMFYGKSPLNK
jgi:hypothetical protein